MLDEIHQDHQRQRRDKESKPGRFPGEEPAKEHRTTHDVQGNQTPEQAKADEEQAPEVKSGVNLEKKNQAAPLNIVTGCGCDSVCSVEVSTIDCRTFHRGRVSEWFMDAVLKTAVGAILPWVRIPPLPLLFRRSTTEVARAGRTGLLGTDTKIHIIREGLLQLGII